jgi:hypothetical protein
MFTTHGPLGWTIADAVGTLRARPAVILSWGERQAAAQRGDDPLRGLPPQIRSDIGLCERAERLPRGRSEPGRAFPDLPSSTLPGR